MTITKDALHLAKPQTQNQARNQLASQHDKLACKIAYHSSLQCAEPRDDLLQLARIGLLKACDKFDPAVGAAFSSFAVPYIKGEIQHFLRDKWQHLKIPRRPFEDVGSNRKFQRLHSVEVAKSQAAAAKLGRAVCAADAAAALQGINCNRWRWQSEAVQRKQFVSLDDVLHLAAADNEDAIESDRLHVLLLAAIAELPKLKRQCITAQFFQQLSKRQISKKLNLPVAEVEALLNQAIADLKALMEEEVNANN